MVIGCCHSGQLRTSYSSKPTSLFSTSNSVSLGQREAETRASVASGVSAGALEQ
jgi:hypothetical protein